MVLACPGDRVEFKMEVMVTSEGRRFVFKTRAERIEATEARDDELFSDRISGELY